MKRIGAHNRGNEIGARGLEPGVARMGNPPHRGLATCRVNVRSNIPRTPGAQPVASGRCGGLQRCATWLVLGVLSVAGGAAQESDGPGGSGFAAFHVIFERNIFNPERSARRPSEAERESEPPRTESRPVETESLTLLGTISYEKGSFGFFGGNRPEFQRAVPLDDSIAGLRLTRVDSRRVRLETNDRAWELPVGKQLSRREDEVEWKIMDRGGPFPQSGRSAEASRGAETGAGREEAEDGAGGDMNEDEILRRLMEKRQQELNNEK